MSTDIEGPPTPRAVPRIELDPTCTITRRLECDFAHRLREHEGKCRVNHGHRYVFEVTVKAPSLDACGRIIDFAVIKQRLGGWLDENWDHGTVLQEGDPLGDFLIADQNKVSFISGPPSIENLTGVFFKVAGRLLADTQIEVVHVRGYETPNCWADCFIETPPMITLSSKLEVDGEQLAAAVRQRQERGGGGRDCDTE